MKKTFAFKSALFLSMLSVGVAALVYANPVDHPINKIEYLSKNDDLVFTTQDKVPLAPTKISHHPWRRELTFVLPHAVLQNGTSKQFTVAHSSIVQSISVLQSTEGKDLNVTVKLNTNAQYLPFSALPQPNGIKFHFVKPDGLKTAVQPPPKNTDTVIKASNTVNKSPSSQELSSAPLKLSSPVVTKASAVKAPLDSEQVSMIEDIYFENNQLNIISKNLPMTVKRSFTLTEPNRYVVDIAPASLESRSLLRIIPHSNPEVTSFRAGQVDPETVRIVVQFSHQQEPVNLNRTAGNHQLTLSFR